MSTALIKVCGLRRPEDIQWANELDVDFVGFVFAPNSRRYVTPAQALELRRELKSTIRSVGVLVNEPVLSVVHMVTSGAIDIIQLHGSEDQHYLADLKEALQQAGQGGTPVIRACSVSCEEDIARACHLDCDWVLLDSGRGGTGQTFDWALVASMDRPFFLAGGLNCDNISQALAACHPMAVDVSSGIETDGVKDFAKMQDFVCRVRQSA